MSQSDWLTAVATAVLALSAVAVALGGYVQFVARRLISVEVDVDLKLLTQSASAKVVELSCRVANHGSSTVVVTGIAAKVLAYPVPRRNADEPERPEVKIGLGVRKHPIRRMNVKQSANFKLAPRIERIDDPKRSTVFPNCTQAYRRPLVLDGNADLLDVIVSADYCPYLGWWSRGVARRLYPPISGLDFSKGLRNHEVSRTLPVSAGTTAARDTSADAS